MYRSPSKTLDDFKSFSTNVGKLVFKISSSESYLIQEIGAFNANSKNWSFINTTTAKGAHLDYLTSFYGMKQVITEPRHILENSSSCIYSNQPKLIMDSGVHSTLHSKCHHQIRNSKSNLKIEHPPPYTRKIWDYNRS